MSRDGWSSREVYYEDSECPDLYAGQLGGSSWRTDPIYSKEAQEKFKADLREELAEDRRLQRERAWRTKK